MKKTFILLLSVATLGVAVQAQDVTVQSAVGQNISNFIKNNLLGQGVYVFNVKFNGQAGSIPSKWNQIGTFQTNGYPGLSMQNGVVMTSGGLSVAAGPNTSTSSNVAISTPYVDPQISNYVTTNGYNFTQCATVDFDFVSLTDNFSFTYCFGSEEYPEYVFSSYNDAFIFLLTGPDPETGEQVTRNIAIVPNSISDTTPNGIAVGVNTINRGHDNVDTLPAGAAENGWYMFDQYYVDNNIDAYEGRDTMPGYHGIEYDGYTGKLTASAIILPCTKYHMHLSICDMTDQSYNSGVYLEGNSFSSPSAAVGLGQDATDTVFSNSPKSIPLTLNNTNYDEGLLYIYFGGQAINGIDYICMSDDGQVVNNGEYVELNNNVRTLTITPLPGSDLRNPLSLDIFYEMALCPNYPELRTKDTMHFVLKQAATEPEDPNGIADVEAKFMGLYPNPASEALTVSVADVLQHVTIIDVAGREVYSTEVAEGRNSITIDVANIEAGVYTVRALTGKGEVMRRVVIK